MPSRRHHYIPQFYLRQWTGEDNKLCEFRIPYDRLIDKRRFPSETGYEDDLYALGPELGVDAQWIEDTFLKITDQDAHDTLRIILSGAPEGAWHFTARQRSGWSRFLMSLLSRTPNKVRMLRAMHQQELTKLAARIEASYDTEHANDPVLPTPQEKYLTIRTQQEISFGMLLQQVMDLPNVGDHINKMIWQVIGVEKARHTLLTSDQPAFLSRGLQHPDSFLTLPISPTQLFVASNEDGFIRHLLRQKPSDIVEESNRQVIQQAINYVYAFNMKQARFVGNHFKKK